MLLIAVILLFPTRVPGESLVPIVLEGAPVIVDDRGLVVGGTLDDNDPLRVVELCGVPLVRFLFGWVRVHLFGCDKVAIPLLDHVSLERLWPNHAMQFLGEEKASGTEISLWKKSKH